MAARPKARSCANWVIDTGASVAAPAEDLRSELARVLDVVLIGRLHDLPDVAADGGTRSGADVVAMLRSLVAAVLPIGRPSPPSVGPEGSRNPSGVPSQEATMAHRLATGVAIAGVGCTPFGSLLTTPAIAGLTLQELAAMAAREALEHAGLRGQDIDTVYLGNVRDARRQYAKNTGPHHAATPRARHARPTRHIRSLSAAYMPP
ncbi:MAG TPA: hypothetical protein VES02_14800 [Dermatophilaceae bacterium]|nr:hypothetical protein [Dermatophilaceae bacterium]